MMASYTYGLMALLPLAAALVVVQQNPYQALIMRGILGSIAALIYAMLGGADVALTEALVGTMLAITLYAVAVRSSLVMRLGVLAGEGANDSLQWQPLLDYVRALLKRYQLRLELVPYANVEALQQALTEKVVHGTCLRLEQPQPETPQVEALAQPSQSGSSQSDTAGPPVMPNSDGLSGQPPYRIRLRVPRLYTIFTTELPPIMAEVAPCQRPESPLTSPPTALEKAP